MPKKPKQKSSIAGISSSGPPNIIEEPLRTIEDSKASDASKRKQKGKPARQQLRGQKAARSRKRSR